MLLHTDWVQIASLNVKGMEDVMITIIITYESERLIVPVAVDWSGFWGGNVAN